eukprot:g4181.t1
MRPGSRVGQPYRLHHSPLQATHVGRHSSLAYSVRSVGAFHRRLQTSENLYALRSFSSASGSKHPSDDNKSDDVDGKGSSTTKDMILSMLQHVWPKDGGWGLKDAKPRVVLALGLLLGGKVINIQVPFLFKDAVDALSVSTTDPTVAVPVGLLVGYGVARSTAYMFQELRNVVFGTVAHPAVRKVAASAFAHLHDLDLRFHLNRQTGALTRVLDRGSRSIQYVMSALIFNVAPTILELGLVCAILTSKMGAQYAAVSVATIASYVAYTVSVTQWRTTFRQQMNKLDSEATTKAVDSLINYETVKYFGNEEREVARITRK